MKKILLLLMVAFFTIITNAQKKQECSINCPNDGSSCFNSSNTASCRCGIFGAECLSNLTLPNDFVYYYRLKEKYKELNLDNNQINKIDYLIKLISDNNLKNQKINVNNFIKTRKELNNYLLNVDKLKLIEIENFAKDYELIKTSKFDINSLKYNIKEDIFEFENHEHFQNSLQNLTREVLLNIVNFSNKNIKRNEKNIDIDSLIYVQKFDYLTSLKNIENNYKFNSYRKVNEDIFNKPITDEKELDSRIPYNPILNTIMNRLGLVKISGKLVDFTFYDSKNLDKSINCGKSFISSNNFYIDKRTRMYSRLKMNSWAPFGGDIYAHNEIYSKICFFGCGWFYNPFKTFSSKSKILDGKTYKCNCETTENYNGWSLGLHFVFKPFIYDIYYKPYNYTIKSEHKYDTSVQFLTNP